mgnify:CR=1 FL=1
MKFALITEGVSEYRVVKHILTRYFKDQDPEINQIQPRIQNEKQETPGGWNEVLKYCEREELNDILIENDFLVIQIDTDQSPTEPFGISHSLIGSELKPIGQLHSEVVQKLKGLIKPEIREKYENRIVFAICVHTIECWLLPIYYSNNHKSDVSNCHYTLNAALTKKNLQGIPKDKNKNSSQSVRTYDTILSNWKKKTEIEEAAHHNFGFHQFVESLGQIKVSD